jgi:hypothetical protein
MEQCDENGGKCGETTEVTRSSFYACLWNAYVVFMFACEIWFWGKRRNGRRDRTPDRGSKYTYSGPLLQIVRVLPEG